ncbi:UDP-galactopyranose mutase [Eubacterium pyruvativorans]|uniref:UDP-galactopyranose mutase n=1 Tax=Eubacterium pyruvativorans TaxID=155865 RepID=A0A1I7H174_9FIRM|nr:UDP-galactopyranose mutase [Eubacterium pyruvativorans]MCI5746353.1 UDP-galactopyranose mutase [Eubacterium pyruvativorans]SFO19388.1 UDP-galactopyranose mutase [Eubacterium pyruvativorans]SFU54437.1 UDP-galactopyranose mutase [Eubacterium pyruvativorans]
MELTRKYDYLIVGAGLFGAVFAQRAVEAGRSVLVLDRRPQIGGNVYTRDVEGIHVHQYGAHIFHTNDRRVWDYVSRFADFNRFTNSPVANYRGEIYSLPFNMYTFNKMWGVVTPEQARAEIDRQKSDCGIGEPRNLEEQAITLVGRDIYEKLVKGYTEKQWGRPCTELPAFIIRRLPVRYTYDNNYFNALFQGIPMGGYTKMVRAMLEGADVLTDTDYLTDKDYFDARSSHVIYTGAIDEYFGYTLGNLEYRSVRFETELLDQENYQGNAAVNYTDRETPWTRIIEHKWFQFGLDDEGKTIPKTVISREFSQEWKPGDEPYYPLNDERNNRLYCEYRKLAESEPDITFGGRLGEYKYYDMDQVIAAALDLADRMIGA